MEPEVHIIEKYLQTYFKWFTVTNITCQGGKEIDLLAIDPQTGQKFHIEASVWTKRKLNLKTLDSLVQSKFHDVRVKKRITEFFGDSQYRKWLVVSPQKVDFPLEHIARDKLGVEIKYIDTMVRMIMRKLHRYGSRDHILRTLEIVKLKEKFDRPRYSPASKKPEVSDLK